MFLYLDNDLYPKQRLFHASNCLKKNFVIIFYSYPFLIFMLITREFFYHLRGTVVQFLFWYVSQRKRTFFFRNRYFGHDTTDWYHCLWFFFFVGWMVGYTLPVEKRWVTLGIECRDVGVFREAIRVFARASTGPTLNWLGRLIFLLKIRWLHVSIRVHKENIFQRIVRKVRKYVDLVDKMLKVCEVVVLMNLIST